MSQVLDNTFATDPHLTAAQPATATCDQQIEASMRKKVLRARSLHQCHLSSTTVANIKECVCTALIVDDTDAQRNAVTRMLERAGCVVVIAETGTEAIAKVLHDSPDLALLDLDLPDMDGVHLALRLKANQKTRSVPVLFYSDLRSPIETWPDRELGGFLTIPFGPEDLLLAIRGTLARATASGGSTPGG